MNLNGLPLIRSGAKPIVSSRVAAVLTLATLALTAATSVAQRRDKGADELTTGEEKAQNVVRPDDGAEALRASESAEIETLIADKEKKLSAVRQRQIVDMRKILDKDPLYKGKADLLFRIAEREWEEAKYRYLLSFKEYERQLEAFDAGTLRQKPEEPKADYTKALIEYKALLKEFPNYKRIDEVMFYLGRGLISAGESSKKEGASYMLRLTREYPKSRFVGRAYLAVAEYYFDADLLVAAKTNYLKVLEDKESSEYSYALYKLGYVHLNLKDYEESIKAFQGVVDVSKGEDRRKSYFMNQAFSGMTLAYAEVDDGWKRARDYFRQVGGDDLATQQLSSIAKIYNRQDKTEDEIAVYEYLISSNKQSKRIPAYAESITAAYKKLEDLDQTEKVINRFVEYFDVTGSWYTVNKEDEEANKRSSNYREEEMDWLIGQYHTKAQEDEKNKMFDRAEQRYGKAAEYYERFLQAFPNHEDLYEKQFFLAEIYFFQKKDWPNSAKNYRGVVERDPKGKYSKDAAYAVILCNEERMADAGLIERPDRTTQKKGSKGDKGKASKPTVEYTRRDAKDDFTPIPETPLHATEEDFVKSCAWFTDLFPKDGEVPAVSFRSAEIYIKKGHYAEGVQRLEVIMEHHPKHEFAGFAAATLFDANYRLRRWDQMERWARYMLERKNYKVLSEAKLRDVIAISINEYAQELNEKGEKERAIEEMLRFVKEFPKHDKAPIALFNAAAIAEGAEKTEQAIDLYESLIKRYPKVPQSTEAHFVLGALYESQTDFETAATYFEKMASFPDVPQMADALYNAGAIRAALEQYDKAIDIFGTYVKKFPAGEDTPGIMLQIAEFHEKESNWAEARRAYDAYLKAFGSKLPASVVSVSLRKAETHQKEGGKNARAEAGKELATALRAYKKLPEDLRQEKSVRRAAAQARFLEAEYIYQEYEAVKVSFPDHVLRKTLIKKAELQQASQKAMFEVTEFNAHDVTAGALYRLGESYYLFAKSLFDLPLPPELNEDEQIIYRAELDDKAAPLQEKAIEAVGNALRLAHKNNVYNQWSQRSARLLVKLSPEAFPVLEDAVVNTEWQVPATFSRDFLLQADAGLVPKPEPKAPPTPADTGADSPAPSAEGSPAAPVAAPKTGGEGSK